MYAQSERIDNTSVHRWRQAQQQRTHNGAPAVASCFDHSAGRDTRTVCMRTMRTVRERARCRQAPGAVCVQCHWCLRKPVQIPIVCATEAKPSIGIFWHEATRSNTRSWAHRLCTARSEIETDCERLACLCMIKSA